MPVCHRVSSDNLLQVSVFVINNSVRVLKALAGASCASFGNRTNISPPQVSTRDSSTKIFFCLSFDEVLASVMNLDEASTSSVRFEYRNITPAALFDNEVLINLPSHSKISFYQKLIMTSTLS